MFLARTVCDENPLFLGEIRGFFMRRPAYGNLLLTQYAGRATSGGEKNFSYSLAQRRKLSIFPDFSKGTEQNPVKRRVLWTN